MRIHKHLIFHTGQTRTEIQVYAHRILNRTTPNTCLLAISMCVFIYIHIQFQMRMELQTYSKHNFTTENSKSPYLSIDKRNLGMGWLRLVGSLKLQVSFAEYRRFCRPLLQRRPIILRSLLIVATPYVHTDQSRHTQNLYFSQI